VLFQRFKPISAPKRGRLRALGAALIVVGCLDLQAAAGATELPRIASINVCTDQLLMALADPSQILGLSPYSRDPVRSWAAAEASLFRGSRDRGRCSDPTARCCCRRRFTRLATRELLKGQGLRVVEFDAARSLDDVRKQIA